MYRYFKRRWNETRGDNFDSWGFSTWYFEVNVENYVTRQVEEYDNGKRLRYGTDVSIEDNYGGLSSYRLFETESDESEYSLITQSDFESVWDTPINY
jgi:hypothetical protein